MALGPLREPQRTEMANATFNKSNKSIVKTDVIEAGQPSALWLFTETGHRDRGRKRNFPK